MEIRVGENESLESALKRFKRKTARSGILAEAQNQASFPKSEKESTMKSPA